MKTMGALATAILVALPTVLADPVPDAGGILPEGGGVDPGEVPRLPDPTRVHEDWAYARIDPASLGADLAGNVPLRGTAEVQEGYKLHYVSIHVDRWYLGHAEGTTNWSLTLDTATLADGNHTINAYAYATPDLPGFDALPRIGRGERATFSTLNHAPSVVLFEKRMDFTGANAETWTVRLKQDHTGLRVTLLGGGDDPALAPTAQLVLAYKETEDEEAPPLRTWVATYGAAEGGVVVSRPPHAHVEAPGVLALQGAFAGEGWIHVKVEAVPLAPG